MVFHSYKFVYMYIWITYYNNVDIVLCMSITILYTLQHRAMRCLHIETSDINESYVNKPLSLFR